MTVRIGVFGTSWWADAMYLPPLDSHPEADVVAVCGRRSASTQTFAERWGIGTWFTEPERMLDEAGLDAVIIATSNDSHHALALASLARGLHVLCEKPLALDAGQGAEMVAAADRAGVVTLVPFTYHYMPVNRWVHRLIGDGYVGTPIHANIRYYTDFGFDPTYTWRFDRELAGSGVIGDLGSHWIHLSRWLLRDVEASVSAVTTTHTRRAERPDGSDYDRTEDNAVLTVRYVGGAYAILQVSATCWEGTPFGQTHHLEVHGDEGTIYATCDWDTVQEVRGVRRGEATGLSVLPIPDDIWHGARRDTVHNTYRDIFRTTDAMTRGWVDAIAEGKSIEPGFADAQAVQLVLDAAVRSAASGGCPVGIE